MNNWEKETDKHWRLVDKKLDEAIKHLQEVQHLLRIALSKQYMIDKALKGD